MKNSPTQIKVDAVIPWVDGTELKWQNKLNKYAKTKIDFSKKKQSVRFNNIGEINFAIKSIIKHAPFIQNIFLITDGQTPNEFDQLVQLAKKNNIGLKIVDHLELFKGYEEFLPCFNSCSIESLVYKIAELSEYFILLNDDFFIMKNVCVEDFFVGEHPVIRGSWRLYNENRTLRKIYKSFKRYLFGEKKSNRVSFKQLQQNSAKLAGTKKYMRRMHTPAAIRKSTLATFFKDETLLKENIKHRFRDKKQYILSSLAEHLEIANGTFYFTKETRLTYFRSYKFLWVTKLKLFLFCQLETKCFVTLQSLELASKKNINYIFGWLQKETE